MKKVMFEGAEYKVHDWVKFITRDDDGELCTYENRPELKDGCWMYSSGKSSYIPDTMATIPWDDSLIEV